MIWKRKNRNVIDLTEYYRKQQERADEMKASMNSGQSDVQQSSSQEDNSGGMFGFFSAVGSSQKKEEDSGYVDMSSGMASAESNEEKRKRFAKRIADMTEKIESLSNQVYRLQQRVDVLERKESGY